MQDIVMETLQDLPTHVFTFPITVDREKLIESANKLLPEMPLEISDPDGWPCAQEDWITTFYQPQGSTQGIILDKADKKHYRITIPHFASNTDIQYAFILLRTVGIIDLGASVMHNGKQAVLTAEAEQRVWEANKLNMLQALDQSQTPIMVEGCIYPYFIFKKGIQERHPGLKTSEDLVDMAYDEFIKLEESESKLGYWPLDCIEIPIEGDEDEYEYEGGRIIQVLNSEKSTRCLTNGLEFGLERNGQIKIVSPKEFYEKTFRHPKIEAFSDSQYLVDALTKDEYDKLWEILDGEIIEAPKTYLLRWNPAISSFSIKDYKELCNDCLDVWELNWSVYDWKAAKAGDRFYMLREGDGINPGIIFRGIFTSDPYPGEDWRGQGIPRHYVDLECYDGVLLPKQAPWITPDELEKAIPEINWRKGHSGELLTPAQADKLGCLWNKSREL